MNNNIFQIIIFGFVCFARIQSQTGTETSTLESTTVTQETTSVSSTIFPVISDSSVSSIIVPVASDSSVSSTIVPVTSDSSVSSTIGPVTSDSSVSTTIGPVASDSSVSSNTISVAWDSSTSPTSDVSVSTGSHGTDNPSSISPITTISSGDMTSPNVNTLTGSSSSPLILTNSTSTIAPPATTSPTGISVTLIFKYLVESTVTLQMGNITNNTILAGVTIVVNTVIKILNFNIIVTRIEIRSRAKAPFQYDMLLDLQFKSNRNDCDRNCIRNATLSAPIPTQKFLLPADNGSSVEVNPTSTLTEVEREQEPTNYPRGESPPGLAAQLGMGLGISIISIIIIVEIIYFYRKSRMAKSSRQSNYELPPSTNRDYHIE